MSVIFRILNKLALITSIIIDVSVDGARIKLFTGYKIKVADWDFKKGFVKTYPGKSTNVLISRRLKETELTIYEYLDQYRYGKPRLTFIELEEKLNQLIDNPRTSFNKNKKSGLGRGEGTFLNFADYFIKDSEAGVRLSPTKKKLKPSTINSFKTTRKKMSAFFNSKGWDLKIWEVTQEHIDMISDHLILDLEWSMNTHAKFMMDLLQIFKYAVKLKKLPPAILTELKFDTSREETDAIYITMDQIMEMYEITKFDLPEQEVVRDMFVIGCFTGMRFSDYSVLDPSAIRNNRLSFIQVKTGAKVTIPIHSIVNEILQKYNYVLPPVPRNNEFNAIIKTFG